MSETARVRLLFVDEGCYHHEDITIPAAVIGQYDRLIDCLCEDPEILRRTFVDTDRLCSARVVEAAGGEA